MRGRHVDTGRDTPSGLPNRWGAAEPDVTPDAVPVSGWASVRLLVRYAVFAESQQRVELQHRQREPEQRQQGQPRQQYAWVRGRFPDAVALFQVGAYYEFYDRRDAPIAGLLGLQPLGENPRGALFGVPERLFGRTLGRLIAGGRSVLVVRQGERDWTGIRERVVAWRMVPVVGSSGGGEARATVTEREEVR